MSLSNGKSPSGDPDGETPPSPDSGAEASKPERKKRKRRVKPESAAQDSGVSAIPATTISNGTISTGTPAESAWTPWPVWLVPLPAVLGLLVLLGLAWLGWQNQKTPAPAEIALDQLVIELPPHLERRKFLDEVRYLGNLPEKLTVGSEDHLFRLKAALGKHPWVRSVESIEPVPSRENPTGLMAKAAIRRPVLLVPVDPALSSGGKFRLVDEAGVLLPVCEHALFAQLAETVPGPAGQPGELWGNPTVESAAALAGWFARQDQAPVLQIIKGSPQRWMLAIENRWVVWNEGAESISPAQMSAKLAELKKRLSSTPPGTPLNLTTLLLPR